MNRKLIFGISTLFLISSVAGAVQIEVSDVEGKDGYWISEQEFKERVKNDNTKHLSPRVPGSGHMNASMRRDIAQEMYDLEEILDDNWYERTFRDEIMFDEGNNGLFSFDLLS